jgi:DNA-binding NarL/FixJ family response regulator
MEKILLVDNSPGFRDSVREFLEQQGYQVIEASDPASAKGMMGSEDLALAVIDIRLVDDKDEKDVSGLTLARQTDPSIPKIILTAFPTYQAVREALGPSLDGLPLAVGFVAKNEGVHKLLATIRLAKSRLNPRFEARLLKLLGLQRLVAVVNRMDELGPSELARLIQVSYEATIRELSEQIKLGARQAAQLHRGGMICGAIAIVLIVAVVAAVWLGEMTPTLISCAASAISKIASAFFYQRESEAQKRLSELYEELREVERERYLPLLCNAFEKAEDRDEYRRKTLDQILR